MGFKKYFSFIELTSNKNGKSSASGTAGLFLILIGGLSFVAGIVLIENDILLQSISLCYAGALLLGFRKSRKDVPEEPES